MTLQSIRDFSADRLTDEKILELDHDDVCPEDTVRAMGGDELGVQLLFIPEKYDGMGGNAFDVYRVCEEMARRDVGIATGVLATFLGSDPIVYGGTEEQQAKWLGKIATEGVLMAYGATEPQAGSDLAALRTKAVPVEEDGEVIGYRLSGNKQWISNGGIADVYTILANAPGGPSWFVLEQGAEGFGHGKPEDKHGIRLSNTTTLELDDVFVPKDNLIGGVEGQGLAQAQKVFGFTRLMVAAFGLGAGREACERAIAYSVDRIQGGSPLSEKQGYTHKLIVPHVIALETARAFIEDTAQRLDSGEGALNTEGAIAKYLATEAGNAAADAAIQALGGYGYTREYIVEKIKRDVRITTIYEGTSEIMEMTISRDRWQAHLRTRGEHYREMAKSMRGMALEAPNTGAATSALALDALATVLETARVGRLTRNQHVLFRLGELVAQVEGAQMLSRKAALASAGALHEKVPTHYDATALAAMSRVAARNAAMQVVNEGSRWICGADGIDQTQVAQLHQQLGLAEVHAAQRGLIQDMSTIADIIYARA